VGNSTAYDCQIFRELSFYPRWEGREGREGEREKKTRMTKGLILLSLIGIIAKGE